MKPCILLKNRERMIIDYLHLNDSRHKVPTFDTFGEDEEKIERHSEYISFLPLFKNK